MRQALAKKLFAGSITAVTALMLGVMSAVPAFAATSYPTLKFTGGDALAGGWFGDSCQLGGNPYQDAAFTNSGTITDHSAGGIYTYTGSNSQYAAYALGVIDKTAPTPPNGFATSTVNGASQTALSFGNIDYLGGGAIYNGGDWDGGLANVAHCIPDYYKDKLPATGVNTLAGTLGNGPPSGAYSADGTGATAFNLVGGAIQINSGTTVNVFVKGNVYIGSDIRYDPSHTVNNIPKFALIATGNIYVGQGVDRLDGLYIAQPGTNSFNNSALYNANEGEFWSCHDNNPTVAPMTQVFLNGCTLPLTVNGAVIAKRANLMRTNGGSSVGETFNYTPEMVIGGTFFPFSSPVSGGSNNQPVFDRIISLPPVF